MSLKLTPEILTAGYEFLCATQPFDKWGLPPSDSIIFEVCNLKWKRGYFQSFRGGKRHKISVSAACVGYSHGVLAILGHEMIHLKQRIDGKDWGSHGTIFLGFAKRVCFHHGYDLKEFV